MGENIGDVSGLAAAYRAYRLSLGGKPAPVIGGYTGDQRFFMGYAQIWRTKMRDDALRQQLLTDPHSPGPVRAYVPAAQQRRVPGRLEREAGRQDVPGARAARADLVGRR
jgi:predicted metalloendopeptidase